MFTSIELKRPISGRKAGVRHCVRDLTSTRETVFTRTGELDGFDEEQ